MVVNEKSLFASSQVFQFYTTNLSSSLTKWLQSEVAAKSSPILSKFCTMLQFFYSLSLFSSYMQNAPPFCLLLFSFEEKICLGDTYMNLCCFQMNVISNCFSLMAW